MELGSLVIDTETGAVGIVVAREPTEGIFVLWSYNGLITEFPWNIFKKAIKII